MNMLFVEILIFTNNCSPMVNEQEKCYKYSSYGNPSQTLIVQESLMLCVFEVELL